MGLGETRGRQRGLHAEENAQGTLEYALVVSAFLVVVTVLALLWRAGEQGAFVELAVDAASHAFTGTGPLDIALF